MLLWRISEHLDLSGVGGTIAAGRWHRDLRPIIYTSATPSGALLETLVHLDAEDAPDSLNLMKIYAPEAAAIETMPVAAFEQDTSLQRTKSFGDLWLRQQRTPLLRVPSIIMPETWNILLNPVHPDAERVTILSAQRFGVDPRLF